RRLFGAFQELLTRVAERHRLVLVIDDFQWADADSRSLLSEIIHPPEAPSALVLVTERSGNAIAEGVRPLADIALDVRLIRLKPLPLERARELVDMLGVELVRERPALADEIAREAGGHPMFVLELLRHAAEDDGAAGTRLDDVLWARVSRL